LRDYVDFEAENLRHRGAAFELLETLVVDCNRDRAALVIASGLPGLGFEILIEFACVAGQPCHIHRWAELPNQPGGVPGRSACQLLAFQQNDVGPADFCKVVRDRTADHAAADDNNTGLFRKFVFHISS